MVKCAINLQKVKNAPSRSNRVLSKYFVMKYHFSSPAWKNNLIPLFTPFRGLGGQRKRKPRVSTRGFLFELYRQNVSHGVHGEHGELKTHVVSRKSISGQSPCSLPLALCYSVSRQSLTTHNSQLTTHSTIFPSGKLSLNPTECTFSIVISGSSLRYFRSLLMNTSRLRP